MDFASEKREGVEEKPNPEVSQWYWIIDGLDKAEKPEEIVQLIGKIRSRTGVRVLMASREGMGVERDVGKLR